MESDKELVQKLFDELSSRTGMPEPGAQLTSEQKMLYRNLLLQSGNHEMQKYNTGVAGYKLEGVGSITERIGDIASQGLFLGGSKIVNS